MSKITGNEPAVGFSIPQNFDNYYEGLTIRQQFAMAAMQGICAAENKGIYASDAIAAQVCAHYAVLYADALINELNKSEK